MSIGEMLRKLRKEKGLTQDQLSKEIGISKSALIHYERNEREPNFNALTKIQKYFGVSAEYLSGKSSYKNISEYIFDNEVINLEHKFMCVPMPIKKRARSILNSCSQLVDDIIKHHTSVSSGRSENDMDEFTNKMFSSLYVSIYIYNLIFSSNFSPSKELWENDMMTELEFYKHNEVVFKRHLNALEKELYDIFSFRCKSLYEEYVSSFEKCKNDKDFLRRIDSIRKEVDSQTDPYPRFK